MTTGDASDAGTGSPAGADRVTSLELFFDLVFVFTITQLTSLLVKQLTWETLWHTAVMLGLIFWMYDGYVWLTNAVPARGPGRQILLLGGMAGFLVLAIAIPRAFDGTGLVFGLALFVITLIHTFLYVRFAAAGSSAAMRRVGTVNLTVILIVVVAATFGGTVQAVTWTAVFLFDWWFGTRVRGFELQPAHFVERHGLLVLIVIGESIIAIGSGTGNRPIDAGLVALVVLGLALCATLWWAYFGGEEDTQREHALRGATGRTLVHAALEGFGYGHYLILLGVVLAAVGIEAAVAQPGTQLGLAHALALNGGVALFLAGDAWFRRRLGLRRANWRTGLALAMLLVIPAGTAVSGAVGLAATTTVLAIGLALEQIRSTSL